MGKSKKTKKVNSTNRLNRNFNIQNKKLSIEDIENNFKEKILIEKQSCKKDIIRDSIGCTLLSIIDIILFYCIFNSQFNLIVLGALLVFILTTYITVRLVKPLPSRIYNYKNFNFERTYYATVTNKTTNTYKDMYGNINESTCLYLKLYENKKIIKKHVDSKRYSNLKVGSKVILTSFDNYNTYIVAI